MSREQLDDVVTRIPPEGLPDLFAGFDLLLPRKEPWSGALRIWGDESSHDVQIWFDGDGIESIQFRIDVTDRDPALVARLARLPRALGCVFTADDGAIVQPSAEAVARAVVQSTAARFVADPQGYIEAATKSDEGGR